MMDKPHPIKTPIKEHAAIKRALAKWHKEHDYTINTQTQFGRVVKATASPAWKTLRQIETLIGFLFPSDPDTQAAISARLREVTPAKCGLVKQRRHYTASSGKIVYVYRLVPAAYLALKQLEAMEAHAARDDQSGEAA